MHLVALTKGVDTHKFLSWTHSSLETLLNDITADAAPNGRTELMKPMGWLSLPAFTTMTALFLSAGAIANCLYADLRSTVLV